MEGLGQQILAHSCFAMHMLPVPVVLFNVNRFFLFWTSAVIAIMFALVYYNDDYYEIQDVSNLRNWIGSSASVKYKNRKWCKVNVLYTHDSREILKEIKDQLDGNRIMSIHLSRYKLDNDDRFDKESETLENESNDIYPTALTSHENNNVELLHEALKHNVIILQDIVISPAKHVPVVLPVEDMAVETNINFQDRQLENDKQADKKITSQKKHCCLYCHKLVFKIYRHYINVHKKEAAVKEIIALPEKTSHRKKLLDQLRKKGDFLFNTQLKHDAEKSIVCRETLKSYKMAREKDVPCPSCMGFYSKYSIRHHIEKCIPSWESGRRRGGIQVECRKLQNNIHSIASDVLRNKVFPVLNDDEVTNVIRYDEAVINYANYLCRKYTTEHNAAQIRSNLRALGKLILAMKKINPTINNLYEALDASHVNLIIKAIDEVAGLDDSSNLYRAPSTAMLLATELKKLCKLMIMEFIKRGDKESQKRMKDVYTVFNLEFHVTVNKKGLETQKINSRRKKTTLPKTNNIAQFRIYLENKIKYYIDKLQEQYSKAAWTALAEYTLVHLAVFNRKRPGETQRLLIDDYKHFEVIEECDITDDYDSLSKEQIKKWARIRFTGKLGNNTALLVHRELGFKAINLILKHREEAGVNKANRYVFGVPSQFRTQSTFQACQLINKFASESNVENPELLRTRLLRQHLATETATSSIDNRLEGRVSDFMAHKRQIHEDYYVMTQKNDDIIKVSQLLENFSSSKEECHQQYEVNNNLGTIKADKREQSELCISTSTKKHMRSLDEYEPSDETELSSDEDETLTQAEVNSIIGKKRPRRSWDTSEKSIAKKYFHEEIQNGKPVNKAKVKEFFESHRDIYKHRTPHLIMQWIKIAQMKIAQQENGIEAKRIRWSTPEKEVLNATTKNHSKEGTFPQISECELLFEKHDVLKNRNPHSIKSHIYSEIKRLSKSF